MNSYRAYVFSHVGNSRDLQQDNYWVGNEAMLSREVRDSMASTDLPYCEVVELQASGSCAFVCDGMGGHAHGEIASLTAVHLLHKQHDKLLQAVSAGVEAMQDIISGLNDEFCHIADASRELRTMGTTLCGVVFKDDHIFGINTGDSRLYMCQNGLLKRVTVDHTEGQRLKNMGLLTEEEVQRFPNRKAIYKYIGQRVKLKPDIFEIGNVIPGSVLLLSTDGMTDVVNDDELREILCNSGLTTAQKGKELVSRAVDRNLGYGDNITVILIDM